MKKILWIVVLLIYLSTASAKEEDYSEVDINVTKVAGNIYMLEGSGGNIAASIGDDG